VSPQPTEQGLFQKLSSDMGVYGKHFFVLRVDGSAQFYVLGMGPGGVRGGVLRGGFTPGTAPKYRC
jgi:hypothetical protein